MWKKMGFSRTQGASVRIIRRWARPRRSLQSDGTRSRWTLVMSLFFWEPGSSNSLSPARRYGLPSKPLDGQRRRSCLHNRHFGSKHNFPIFLPPVHLIQLVLEGLSPEKSPLSNEAGQSPQRANPFPRTCRTYQMWIKYIFNALATSTLVSCPTIKQRNIAQECATSTPAVVRREPILPLRPTPKRMDYEMIISVWILTKKLTKPQHNLSLSRGLHPELPPTLQAREVRRRVGSESEPQI